MNSLRKIKGKKIRMQYFNLILFLLAFGLSLGFVLLAVELLKNAGLNLDVALSMDNKDTVSLVKFSVEALKILAALLALSVLNRLFFGKTVCVANEEGLHLEKELVKWDTIESVHYVPTIPVRPLLLIADIPRYGGFAHIEMKIRTPEGSVRSVNVEHFPYYGLRVIRKHSPDARVSVSRWVIYVPLFMLALIVFYGFYSYFDR